MNSSETLDSREDDPNPVSITTNNTNTRAGSSGSRNVEKKKSPSKLGTISSGMRRNSVELPIAPTAASRSRFDSIGSNASHSSVGSNSYVPYPTSSQFYDSDSNNTNSSVVFEGGRNKYPYTHLMLNSGRQKSMNRPTHERDPSDTSMLSMDSLDFPTNNEPTPSTLPYHKRKLLRSDVHGKVDESTQNNQQEKNFAMNKQKVGFSNKANTNRQDKKSNNQVNQQSYRNKRPPAGLSISPGIASNSSDRNHNPPPRNLPPTGNAEHNRMRSFSADLPNSSASRNQSVSSLSTSSFQRNNNNNNIFNSNRSRASTTDNTVNSSSQQRKQKLSRPPMLEKRSSTVPAPPVSVSPANSVNSFQRRGQSSYRGNMGLSPTHRGTNSDVLTSLSSQLAKDVKSFFTGDSKTNKEEHQRKDSSDSSFFGGLLSSLSPSNQQTLSIEDEKQDFHQRNQQFLAKMKQQERSTYNLPQGVSPSSSIRNNQYKRSHRTLDSIGDDDWGSDSYLDEDLDKTEKRNHRNKVPSNVDTIVSDDPHFNFNHVPDNRNKYELNEKRNHKEKISPTSSSYLRYVDNQRTSPNNQNLLSYDDDSHDYSLSSVLSSSEDDEDDTSFGDPDGEHTSLLPPTGISTHEPYTSYASTGKSKRYDDNEWQDNYYRSNRNTPTSSKKKRQGRMYEHEQRRSETRRLRDMQVKMDAKVRTVEVEIQVHYMMICKTES